jgi:hypothetical protein
MKNNRNIENNLAINTTRQSSRVALMLNWFLLMPVTLYYFSPYLLFMGLMDGIVRGGK